MLSWQEQLRAGYLVCPRSRKPLAPRNGDLLSSDGAHCYPVIEGVPRLLADPSATENELAKESGAMREEYSRSGDSGLLRRIYRNILGALGDQRTPESVRALADAFPSRDANTSEPLCLSIGGGPQRIHPLLVNVNIDAFPGVDVVGDAYALPYANDCAAMVHCEAVLEHLESPEGAVAEIHRVLRPGGCVFAATPFLQPYHGYPDHFQNFTLTGHVGLFRRTGFTILAAGSCVGPAFALRDLAINYLREVIPSRRLGKLAAATAAVLSLPVLLLDRIAWRVPGAVKLASTTFVLAAKATKPP
jgi:SAM-dependent methyltransferase/uncharacterized protein YbaR (Trm112 family)